VAKQENDGEKLMYRATMMEFGLKDDTIANSPYKAPGPFWGPLPQAGP